MRTLLIRPGAIGDVIVSLPALEHLKSGYTEVWVPTAAVPLIRFADRVDSIARTGLDMLSFNPSPVLWERLRSFDRIYSWYGSQRDAMSSLPITFFPALPNTGQHAVDFYCGQVGAPSGQSPKIQCEAEPGDYVVIHPFSGSPKKNWPLDRFQELANRLPNALFAEEPGGVLRHGNLYDLARWIAGARAFVGNDSGVTHLAAAVGTPVVALFGPTDRNVWAPRGPRVCILPIEASVEAVLDSLP
jgi:heptosyltransferase-3